MWLVPSALLCGVVARSQGHAVAAFLRYKIVSGQGPPGEKHVLPQHGPCRVQGVQARVHAHAQTRARTPCQKIVSEKFLNLLCQCALSHIGNLRDHGVIINKTGLESHLQKIAFKSEECKACSLSVFCPLCCPYAPFEGDCVSLVEELLTFTLSHIESLIGRSLFAGAPSAQTYDVNGAV